MGRGISLLLLWFRVEEVVLWAMWISEMVLGEESSV
jgi:hypothetical protein